MKKVALLLAMIFVALGAKADGVKRAVTFEQLPAAAQSFLKQHFAAKTIAYAIAEDEYSGTEYEVYYSDGTEVEFRADGNWKSVDCKFSAVPASIVPANIASFVASSQYGAGQFIKEIHRKVYGYELELSSGLELKFNAGGQFLGVDD